MKVRAKKHLGQHFLKDENIARSIVDSLTWQDYNQALEIGPGTGVLTKYLLSENKNVSVVEIDSESVQFLKNNYSASFPDFKIHEEDFLKMDLKQTFGGESFAVLGNFPYNISSQIIFKIIENKTLIPEMVGMFQKEVAERIAAKEGNKTYGIISVLTQAYYKVEYLFSVSEAVFSPPPKVKSGVIRINRFREKLEVNDALFSKVVKAGFNQRRKTLRNALKILGVSLASIDDNLLNLRAEQLSVAQFIELTKKLENEH